MNERAAVEFTKSQRRSGLGRWFCMVGGAYYALSTTVTSIFEKGCFSVDNVYFQVLKRRPVIKDHIFLETHNLAIQNKNADATLELALYYAYGIGTSDECLNWINKAVAIGNPTAAQFVKRIHPEIEKFAHDIRVRY